MNSAIEYLQRHFDEREIRYQAYPDHNCVRATFSGAHSTYEFALTADEQLFQVFAKPFFSIPEGARNQVSDLCARMNYGLKLGKWEFDPSDGEIRYQAATCLTDEKELTDRMIGLVMGACMAAIDRYVPAILSCVYGNESPADAVRHAESA